MRRVGPRLAPMVSVSAAAHLLVFGYLLFAVRPAPRVIYRPPAYVVDLVEGVPAAAAPPAPPPPAAPPPR
ncbi:MAG TPA: hypothetical protein VNM66_04855, partial [Thermodesulfobacteriota bacterium]|nr:hypothetical protein [Thermodesulfobacteriota bacterium]